MAAAEPGTAPAWPSPASEAWLGPRRAAALQEALNMDLRRALGVQQGSEVAAMFLMPPAHLGSTTDVICPSQNSERKESET